MKKGVLKSLTYVVFVFSIMCAFMLCANAKEVVSGDFKFEVSSTSATLKEYTGTKASVTIPSKVSGVSVKKIGAEAFWQNRTMTSVTIPSTVTVIEEAAFNECTALKKVVIPSKVKTIESGAFWYCTGLKKIVIPKSVTKIGENAFKGCNLLTAYVEKGSYAESYVKKLDHVKLGYRYASSMKLSSTSVSLAVGSETTLKATLSPSVLYNSAVSYKSSNTAIAKVSSSGKITAVSAGTAKITVTAKDGSGVKATCTVKVIPTKVTSLKQSGSTKDSITLSWSKSVGAARYKVYKQNSKGEWISLGTTASTSYKLTGLELGTSLKIRVRGYKKVNGTVYYSSASSAIAAKTTLPSKVTGVSATATSATVTVSWKKATDADGYRVYLLDTATGKLVKKASTTSLKAKISNLSSNTKYTFIVKSYLKHAGKVLECAEASNECVVYTRPTYVQNFKVKENSVFFDRLTLTWDKLPGVTGYRIDVLNSKGDYEKLYTTYDVNETSYTVKGLETNTEYSFKIRAFTKTPTAIYSYYSDPVKATTLAIPESFEDAFNEFLKAYNASKNYSGNATFFGTKQATDITVTEGFSYLCDYVIGEEEPVYNFTAGETQNGLKLTDVLSPFGEDLAITVEDILLEEATYKENGSGYELSFTLKDTAENDLISSIIDWQGIAAENEGFVLDSCVYGEVKVNAKVQDGKISYIEIEMPFEATFTVNGEQGVISETLVTLYALTYS